MNEATTISFRLSAVQESERHDRERYHTSLYLTRQDVAWLDALAAMYSTNRSAVARLVLAEARRLSSQEVPQ
jgi:hypothetical protein